MPSHGFPVDPASDVLGRVRMRVDLVCRSTFHAPWALSFQDGPSHLHVVQSGIVWARLAAGEEAVKATAGDVLLFARGAGHTIADTADRVAVPLEAVASAYDPTTMSLKLSGSGRPSQLVCCRFNFDGGATDLLLRALPPLIHVKAGDLSSGQIADALGLLASEIRTVRPGSTMVVSRLIEILFVEILRAWAHAHDRNLSWLAGVGDVRIGRVLAALHEDPARAWKAIDCARIAGLSRSAFADRFTRVVGETPLAYLKHWRLSLAADLIASGAPTSAEVARRVGYTSDSAFNRAFKHRFQITPAAFRRGRRAGRQG